MKSKSFLFILNILITNNAIAGNCDSIVIQEARKLNTNGGSGFSGVSSLTYRDGLLSTSTIDNASFHREWSYSYDSLGKIVETYLNDILYSRNLYYSNGLDSVILFYNNNINPVFNRGQFYYYDQNNNIYSLVDMDYDSISLSWDTSSYKISNYSSDSLTRVDSLYAIAGFSSAHETTTWDSLHRIVATGYNYGMYFGSATNVYDSVCTSNILYKRSHYVIAGPGVQSGSANSHFIFDSLCRPVYRIDSSSTSAMGNVTWVTGFTNYYYIDCNQLLILGPDTIAVCVDSTSIVDTYVLGGSGGYSYLWTPNDTLSNDTILNPVIYTSSDNNYLLSVHDTAGNTASFQVTVLMNQFSTTITAASCSTCSDGIIDIHPISQPNNFYLTVSPVSGSWNGTTLSGVNTGDYLICSAAPNCTTCNTVHVGDLISVEEIGDLNNIQLYPNPVNERLLVNINYSVFKPGLEWTLRDIEGRILRKQTENKNQFYISVEDVSRGIYLFEVILDARYIYKVIVE